ncbi:MAG: DMT family transporter [Candidatus Eisenbacteria bacterium]
MKGQNKAYLFAILAVACWSTVASAFKLTLREVDYLTLLLYSSLTSTVFLFVVLAAQRKLSLVSASLRPSHISAGERGQLLRSAANGFLNPFLYYVVLFKAYSLLPAQEAQPLNFTWPIMLVILSAPMLGERLRPLSVAALLISFLGVLIVSTHGDLLGFRVTNALGALLAMGSAVVWAFFWLINVRDKRDEMLKLFLNFLFGFCYIFVTVLVLRFLAAAPGARAPLTTLIASPVGEAVPSPMAGAIPPPGGTSLAGLLGCVYVGILEMGAAFVLWLKALKLSETTAKVSNLIFLSPFVSLIFIRFVVGEKILPSSIVGLTFIAGGILLQRALRYGPER